VEEKTRGDLKGCLRAKEKKRAGAVTAAKRPRAEDGLNTPSSTRGIGKKKGGGSTAGGKLQKKKKEKKKKKIKKTIKKKKRKPNFEEKRDMGRERKKCTAYTDNVPPKRVIPRTLGGGEE